MVRLIKLKPNACIVIPHTMVDHKQTNIYFKKATKQFLEAELPIIIFKDFWHWQNIVNYVCEKLYINIYEIHENMTFPERLDYLRETVVLCVKMLTKQLLPNLAIHIADNAILSLDHSLKTIGEILGPMNEHETNKFINIMLLKSIGVYDKPGIPSSIARQICPTCQRIITIHPICHCDDCSVKLHIDNKVVLIQSLWRGVLCRLAYRKISKN